MKRVLIISAHPDDEILGCGGLISKYGTKEVVFKVVFISEGSTCRFQNPQSDEAIAAVEQRNLSAVKALALLGIEDVEFNNLPCGRLDQTPILIINKIIETAIKNFVPDTLLTHSYSDANNDHRVVYRSVLMATRPVENNPVDWLMTYEILSSSEWAFAETFAPNYFEELSKKDVEAKWRALSQYESEIREYPFPRSEEGVRTLAMMRGMQSGYSFAEAYHIVRVFQT